MSDHQSAQPSPGEARWLTVGLIVGRPLSAENAALHCGVRDYAVRLAESLRDTGVDARVLAPASWTLRDWVPFVRTLRAEPLDILHLQYPSIGHRASLLPHALGLSSGARRFVATLHEHSALQRPQRIANHLFRATTRRLIFTTDYEARAFGAGRRVPVIPIGSNVPAHPGSPTRRDIVLYFGQIRPEKGLEDFVELAALSAGAPTRFVIFGSAPPRWRDYGDALRSRAGRNVAWIEDASLTAVAEAMATATAAYLPFPDGAGLRRGSLLAALSNGLPVIAPFGPSTTVELRAALLEAESPEAALFCLRLLRSDPARARSIGEAGRPLARRFSWKAIAGAHVAVYQAALERDADATPRREHRATGALTTAEANEEAL
jgi:glycosyltransferase involved in cell wall biosynthesis